MWNRVNKNHEILISKTPESIGMNEKYMYIIFYHDIFYAQKIHELYFSSYKIMFLRKLS